MIKARLYKRNKRLIVLNISGDVDEIKLDDKDSLLVTVENKGRFLKMCSMNDIKL